MPPALVGDPLVAERVPTSPAVPEVRPPALGGKYDLASLRLDQGFTDIAVKPVLLTVPVRKPGRHDWVRVRPGDDWRLTTTLLEDKVDGGASYLVAPELREELSGEIAIITLVTTITRQSTVFLWGLKLPGPDGRTIAWWESAIQAAKLAETTWVRLASNMGLGAYEVFAAAGDLPEPVWPDVSFQQLIEVAFRDRFISDRDHPVLRRLRGEI